MTEELSLKEYFESNFKVIREETHQIEKELRQAIKNVYWSVGVFVTIGVAIVGLLFSKIETHAGDADRHTTYKEYDSYVKLLDLRWKALEVQMGEFSRRLGVLEAYIISKKNQE